MRKTWLFKLDPVSSVSPTDSSTQGVGSGSEGLSKMSAICLALVMYLRSCSGRKLHSLRKWALSGRPACLHSGQDLVGRLGLEFILYEVLLPVGLR